jgi:hypothetical protein
LLLFNALEAALASVSNCTAPIGACSALGVRGGCSKSGEPIVAHNFDYLPLVQPFYILRESRPEHGYRSLEFTAMPLSGAVDGVNEAGLCIAYSYAYANDRPSGPAAPISALVSEVLTCCSKTQDAIDWVVSRPRWGSGLLMLADEDGDLATLELSNSRSAVIRPKPGEDILHQENYFTTPRMREVQVPDAAVYTERSPVPLRGRRLHASSEHRRQRFKELLDQAGPLDRDDLVRIMSDHGPQGEPGDNTLCVHGTYWYTTATLQLLPASRSIRASFSTACQARFAEISLGGRLSVASCQSPL